MVNQVAKYYDWWNRERESERKKSEIKLKSYFKVLYATKCWQQALVCVSVALWAMFAKSWIVVRIFHWSVKRTRCHCILWLAIYGWEAGERASRSERWNNFPPKTKLNEWNAWKEKSFDCWPEPSTRWQCQWIGFSMLPCEWASRVDMWGCRVYNFEWMFVC